MKTREKESLAPAIWNNAIIIISNQISVTEAKNTHHIKAMTRRETEKKILFNIITFILVASCEPFNSVFKEQNEKRPGAMRW